MFYGKTNALWISTTSQSSGGITCPSVGRWISAAKTLPFAPRWCKHLSQPSKLFLVRDPGAVWGLRAAEALLPHQATKWLLRPCLWLCWWLGCPQPLFSLQKLFHCRAPAFYYPSKFWFLYGRIRLNDVNTYSIFSYLKCIFKARLDGALSSLA